MAHDGDHYDHAVGKWCTCCEVAFLDGIGSWRVSPEVRRKIGNTVRREVRERLLLRYAEAIERRTDWGQVDPVAVRAYLAKELGPWPR